MRTYMGCYDFTNLYAIFAVRLVGHMRCKVYVTVRCPSVPPSVRLFCRSTVAATCGWFAAELVSAARALAAAAGSVMLRAKIPAAVGVST